MGSNGTTGFEIAIIGMSGRFPGAKDIHTFWLNLKNGVESICFVTAEELEKTGFAASLADNPRYVGSKGGALEDKELFDAAFFDYSAREAEILDPQMRLLHECAWSSLEDAGYNPETYRGLIGLFAGASSHFNWEASLLLSGKKREYGEFFVAQLIDPDYLATRVSYKLNLKGPSVTVQTACSTSLVAVHLACRALLSGECSMALAGGVTVYTENNPGYIYEEGMILSRDGHCRTFDQNASGTVGGEGVGMVVLRSLDDALTDGDHIYTVIKGSASNNDGMRKVGYTAPSVEGQSQAILAAMHMAEVEPESIGYVETHGSGTILGDPIEIEALKLSFDTKERGFCAIGSVKTNIGHLDRAAGIAGLIKAVLALTHRQIPPSLHFETPNPKIDFETTPFYVNTKLTGWKNGKYPLRAGVSSFGIGGTNVHIVLEEAPAREKVSTGREWQIIPLSARTPHALDRAAEHLAAFLEKYPGVNLTDAAYTLQVGRKHFPYRKMLVCSGSPEARQTLSTPQSKKVHSYFLEKESRLVVFMFPGLGAQYVNMGRELYEREEIFRQEMDRCFGILTGLVDYNIKDILYPQRPDEVVDGLEQTEVAQPVLFVFEYALARLLLRWGIRPHMLIGYSFGEYVAACLSGVFSLEDALKLVVTRGELVQKLPEGGMLSVPLPGDQVEPLLPGALSIAIDNGPSCVVSGPGKAVAAFEEELKKRKTLCIRLPLSHAIHSQMMEPILAEFRACLEKMSLNPPQIPYISNVTGKRIGDGEAVDPRYWCRHLRQTVQFADGLRELMKDPDALFVEVGPGHELSALLQRHLGKDRQFPVVNLVKHPDREMSDVYLLLTRLGILWMYGLEPDWPAFYAKERRYRVPLPTYPFEGKRYWLESDIYKLGREKASGGTPMKKKANIADWFYLPQWERSPLLSLHPLELPQEGCRLVLIDDSPLCASLVKRLSQEAADLIKVRRGDGFRKLDDREYEINPLESDDYVLLMEELQGIGVIPAVIIHPWSISHRQTDSTNDLGLYSLLYLSRAIDKQGFSGELNLFIVTANLYEVVGNETLEPRKAPVTGLARVIPQEYSYIKCRSIDIVVPEARSDEEEKLVEWLAKELSSPSADVVIAYRAGYRWVQTFKPIQLEDDGGDIPVLRQGGVYLITGGLGNMGFTLARFLARTVGARLILTGRTPLPPEEKWDIYLELYEDDDAAVIKIRKIMELKQLGAEVLFQGCDAADDEAMQQIVARAEEKFGPINGVIHAAGEMSAEWFRPLDAVSTEDFKQHFKSKLYGLTTLGKLFNEKELDFGLLVSSPASILGGLGHTAYAAANCFVDAYVYHLNQKNSRIWTAVNWGDWQLGKEGTDGQPVNDPLAYLRMSAQEGVQTFQRILKYCRVNQVVVSAADFQERIDQWVKLEFMKDSDHEEEGQQVTFHSRPDLLTPYVEPSTQMEKTLAVVWQKYFGIDMIGIDDNFFELGATSLDMIQLNRKIRQKTSKDIPVVALFQYPNIRSLGLHLSKNKKDNTQIQKGKERSAKMHKRRMAMQSRTRTKRV